LAPLTVMGGRQTMRLQLAIVVPVAMLIITPVTCSYAGTPVGGNAPPNERCSAMAILKHIASDPQTKDLPPEQQLRAVPFVMSLRGCTPDPVAAQTQPQPRRPAMENLSEEIRFCDETAARELQTQGPFCNRDGPVGLIPGLINAMGACRDRIERVRQQCHANAPEIHYLKRVYAQDRCNPDVIARILTLEFPGDDPAGLPRVVRTRLELNGCIAPQPQVNVDVPVYNNQQVVVPRGPTNCTSTRSGDYTYTNCY
jgi:hypothetical protein